MAEPFDDALVNLVARAEYESDMEREESDDFEPFTWDEALYATKGHYRRRARAGMFALLRARRLLKPGEFAMRHTTPEEEARDVW